MTTEVLFFILGALVAVVAFSLAIFITGKTSCFKRNEPNKVRFTDLPKPKNEDIASRRTTSLEERISNIEQASKSMIDDNYAHFIVLESLIDTLNKEQRKNYAKSRDEFMNAAFKGDKELIRKFRSEHIILRKSLAE